MINDSQGKANLRPLSNKQDSRNSPFFCQEGLKKHKDEVLHTRLEDTIIRCGISKREFYDRVKVSPAYWWRLSWGIDKFPAWLKTKLVREFGQPFIDFFFIQEEKK